MTSDSQFLISSITTKSTLDSTVRPEVVPWSVWRYTNFLSAERLFIMRRRHHHPMRVARVARSIDDPLHNVKLDLPEETPAFVQPEPIVNYSILEKRINCNKKENEKLPECEKPQKSNALPIALGSA